MADKVRWGPPPSGIEQINAGDGTEPADTIRANACVPVHEHGHAHPTLDVRRVWLLSRGNTFVGGTAGLAPGHDHVGSALWESPVSTTVGPCTPNDPDEIQRCVARAAVQPIRRHVPGDFRRQGVSVFRLVHGNHTGAIVVGVLHPALQIGRNAADEQHDVLWSGYVSTHTKDTPTVKTTGVMR